MPKHAPLTMSSVAPPTPPADKPAHHAHQPTHHKTTSTQDIKPISRPNPAARFHATPRPASKPSTLDLRAITPTPASAPIPAPKPTAVTPTAQAPATIPTPSSTPAAIISPFGRTQQRLAKATNTTQSSAISKFGQMVAARIAPTPAPVATQPAFTQPQTKPTDSLSGLIRPNSVQPQTVQAAPPAASAQPLVINPLQQATVPQIQPQTTFASKLPNSVVSQIESLAKAAGPAMAAQSAVGQNVSTTKPASSPAIKPATVVAAIVAIAIMGGYTWINNYPKMTVKTAASKAGIEASIPSYLPANYSLGNGVSFAPGEISFNLHNAQTGDDVAIKQRTTSWDSSSLLENFIAKDTSQYSSVQGQGLTIYLYDNNKASWVNHGIWYSIDATNNLTRDQLLKIAYSL